MSLYALNSEPHSQADPRPERRRATWTIGPRRRFLVATGNCLSGLVIERALRRAGHTVAGIASTADEAVTYARAVLPDLALIDTRLLGERDGIAAAIDIHRTFGTPIIFLAGPIDADIKARAAPASALGWIEKPVDPRTLAVHIERLT
jgi:DNA-binding response OmpR family regulator